MAEFTTTQRGARSLLYGGHSYMMNRRGRDDTIYWRCTMSRNSHCTGSITTGPGDTIITVKDTHNHPPSTAAVEVKKIVSTLKDSVQASIRPVPVVYQEEVLKVASQVTDEVAAKLPTLGALKSSLYRRRSKLIPQLPRDRSEVHFDGEWALTLKGEQFLQAEDGSGDDKLVVFSTAENMKRLAEADNLYVDGTFRTCPRLFYQIFTIHAEISGKHMPLVYSLLPNKRQNTYERLFQILEDKVRVDHQLDLSPSMIVSDFELGIIQAAHAIFPAAVTKGCYFHFCQALLRKVQQLGLQVEYQESQELRSFVHKVAALAFVPLRYVRLGWMGIRAAAPAIPRVDEFVEYFSSTWMSGCYPPSQWNVHELGDCRTNNNLEGWHAKLKKVVGKSHPNIYEIVKVFKMEEATAEVTLAQLQAGARPAPKRRATIDKNRKIGELKRRFEANEITLLDYIRGLSGHTNLIA